MNRRSFRLLWLTLPCALFSAGCIIDDAGPVWIQDNAPTPLTLETPSNLPPITIPEDNPLTVEGVELGRHLFYEPMLSADNTQSCGTCHVQEFGFSDRGRQFSTGIDGLQGDKNAMAIINLGWAQEFFWDGRAAGMENQARLPVINPIEMHESWPNVVAKLQATTKYPAMFEAAFETDQITEDLVVKAIAQFERTMITGNSDYDKFTRGEQSSFSQAAYRGMQVFFTERGDCFHCHTVDLLTTFEYHNNGLDATFTSANIGRAAVTGRSSDTGKFKVPSLHNVEVSGPYMHDGRFATLEEVIEHYNSGIKRSPTLSPQIKKPDGLFLTEQEKSDLLAFLKSLTDHEFLTNPAFSDPN
ncbi:MAG: cytochrome c peroxidase [Bacteroidia bacterium]